MEEKKKRKATPITGAYVPAKEVKQVRDQYGRLVWIHKNVSIDALPHRKWEFSKVCADQICMLITEGYTMKEIGKIDGMPPLHIMYSWTRENKDFKADITIARQDRAHFYHDHAIDTAMETKRNNQVPINKLKIDVMKWAAEKGNAGTYGNKTVHEGNPEAPIQFIIDTGVRREAIEVKAEVEETIISEEDNG